MLSKFMNAIEYVANIKKTEIGLPIARLAGYVTPLLVGDDVSLRTSVVSPVKYDREMTNMLFNHMEFSAAEGKPLKYKNLEQFMSKLSNIDKTVCVWGLYKCTYETLGKRKTKCEINTCAEEFEIEILLEELVHEKDENNLTEHPEDTFTIWDEETPFYDYIYPIEVDYQNFTYVFETCLPTIRQNNIILSNLTTDAIQKNMEAIGSPFTRAEQMALLTKKIQLKPKDAKSAEDIVETVSTQEIIVAFKSYIPHLVSEEFFDKYGKKFDKFVPKFYKMNTCPVCGNKSRHNVDIELEFFRRSVLGRREGVEEL